MCCSPLEEEEASLGGRKGGWGTLLFLGRHNFHFWKEGKTYSLPPWKKIYGTSLCPGSFSLGAETILERWRTSLWKGVEGHSRFLHLGMGISMRGDICLCLLEFTVMGEN